MMSGMSTYLKLTLSYIKPSLGRLDDVTAINGVTSASAPDHISNLGNIFAKVPNPASTAAIVGVVMAFKPNLGASTTSPPPTAPPSPPRTSTAPSTRSDATYTNGVISASAPDHISTLGTIIASVPDLASTIGCVL